MDALARQLMQRAGDVAAGLIHGAAGLLGLRVGVAGMAEHDIMLARLLACHGAKVRWLGPALECADGPALTADLLGLLTQERTDLDSRPLTSDFPTLTDDEPLDMLLVLDALPADGDAALTAIVERMPLVRIGGQLEWMDVPATASAHVAAHAGMRRLAVRNQHGSRLSLLRLAEPLHEYPLPGDEHPAVMAHCLARLQFAAQFVAGADVLEAGSGAGLGGQLFLQQGARRVVCLDWSATALRLGRQATTDPRLQFCRADLNRPLPLAGQSFDVIVCLEVLEHIREPAAAVAEFRRLLRPGGRLLVSIPDPSSEDQWAELNRFRNPYHLRTIGRDELLAWLQDFPHVQLACQRDYIGSAVVAEDDSQPSGKFQAVAAIGGSGSVQIAVASQSPLPPLRSAGPLQLHDNASAVQLSLYQHGRNLEHQLATERLELWRDHNRLTQLWQHDRQRLESAFLRAVRDVARVGGVLLCPGGLPSPPWLDRLAELLRPSPPDQRLRGQPPGYRLRLELDPPALEPVFDNRGPIQTVLFPVPRRQVSRSALRHWLRPADRECWFLEADGWRRGVLRQRDRHGVRLDRLRDWLDDWRQQWQAPPEAASVALKERG